MAKEKMIKLGNGNEILLEQGKDSCSHKWDYANTVYYTESGKKITPYTFIQWVSYTSQFRFELISAHQDALDDPIVSAIVECKKCNKQEEILK